MKFQFDPNQSFQLDAVNSIVRIFEGQTLASEATIAGAGLFGIYPNQLNLSADEVFKNVEKIQSHNSLTVTDLKDFDFSVEMETGTGKTYVYLRTIFELNRNYGWKKFIILVPSIAIREGVIKTLQITKDHFGELYDNVPYRFYEYRSKNLTQVKNFADASVINIMVMTVGAFNRDANVLYGERDQMQGEQPISFIQKTNPVLILDEPQNMEGEATKRALENFNSLCRLRYSATHRNPYNLMYQLTPADAYKLQLVKKIEVYSVTDDESGNSGPTMKLIETKASKTKSGITAKVEVAVQDKDGNKKFKALAVKSSDNLEEKTKNSAYKGYVVSGIEVESTEYNQEGKVHFENGFVLSKENSIEQNLEEIMRNQIAQTIKLHFDKKEKYQDAEIKVLSLFFIDRVDNYVRPDGFIRKTFIEEVQKISKERGLKLDVDKVHKGYFAQRKGEYLEREQSIAENDEAYELIMKDKERLLSKEEPTEFIFSHSALREGWDNPNVFNICTLNQTSSSMKKRQEIGRGMRLCVNEQGERIFDNKYNLLSVIANESYHDYVARLQSEFQEDGIYNAPPVPQNAKQRQTVKLKKGFEKDVDFAGLWERISSKTRFKVKLDSTHLVKDVSEQLAQLKVTKPQIRIEHAGVEIGQEKVSSSLIGDKGVATKNEPRVVDCLDYIQRETKLTRSTVVEIFQNAAGLDAFYNNPEKFCFETVKIINDLRLKQYVDQISYEMTSEKYDAKSFEDLQSYKSAVVDVNRSIYEAVVCDSDVERQFALDLEQDERIKLFIKLPGWYKVETPLGGYNPDWAIVTVKRDVDGKELGEKVYFVIETKGDVNNLRPSEVGRINSAKKHFQVINVNYKEVPNYETFAKELRN